MRLTISCTGCQTWAQCRSRTLTASQMAARSKIVTRASSRRRKRSRWTCSWWILDENKRKRVNSGKNSSWSQVIATQTESTLQWPRGRRTCIRLRSPVICRTTERQTNRESSQARPAAALSAHRQLEDRPEQKARAQARDHQALHCDQASKSLKELPSATEDTHTSTIKSNRNSKMRTPMKSNQTSVTTSRQPKS